MIEVEETLALIGQTEQDLQAQAAEQRLYDTERLNDDELAEGVARALIEHGFSTATTFSDPEVVVGRRDGKDVVGITVVVAGKGNFWLAVSVGGIIERLTWTATTYEGLLGNIRETQPELEALLAAADLSLT